MTQSILYINYDPRIEDRMFREPSNIRFLLPDNIREIKEKHNDLVDYVFGLTGSGSLFIDGGFALSVYDSIGNIDGGDA